MGESLHSNINQIISLITKTNELVNTINLPDLVNNFEKLKQENILLKKELEVKNIIISDLESKYKQDIESKNSELTNLTKVSMLQSANKQLTEKTNYIQILESQLEKLKHKENVSKETVSKETIPKETIPKETLQKEVLKETIPKEVLKETIPKETIPNETLKETFNPDEFEEINGYELILYKKKYYLRDLETNELYSIYENMPKEVVGLINKNGKPKFS